MHVQQEIEICLASQYEESTMEILSLVPRETFALRVELKKKKKTQTQSLHYCKIFVSLDDVLLEVCQLSGGKTNKQKFIDSL